MITMKKLRTLEFYGFSEDNTMFKDDDKLFPVSEIKELKNRKYIKTDD